MSRRLPLLFLLLGLLVVGSARAVGPFARVGIMTATEAELKPLLAAMQAGTTEVVAGRTFHLGRLEGARVVLVEGGVGKVNASLTATVLVSRYRVGLLLFSGVAAALDDQLRIGDVVVSDRAVQSDYVKIAAGTMRPAPVKRLDHDGRHRSVDVLPPRVLIDAALEAGKVSDLQQVLPVTEARPRVVAGTICTGDAFVIDSRHAGWIRRTFGGAVYEMEGAAVGQVGRSFGTPWLVFRGVSDHSNGFSSVTYPITRGRAAQNAALVVLNTLARLQGR